MSEQPPTLGDTAAAALVFGSSAAVLVVELVALRLLAPYLGLTLETNTLVIGIALSAIAVGSWAGGGAADRVDPRRALAPLLAVSGAAVALTPLTVRTAGGLADALLLPAAALAIFVPGALLSAVTPMVTKLRLSSLEQTGTIVGRLSGIGTSGAIAGTVLTGFVLVSAVPVSGILVGLGVVLVACGALVAIRVGRARQTLLPAAIVAVGGLVTSVAPGGCDAETTYHCALLVEDPDNPDGTTLVLDGISNSYVDAEDPELLDFAYVEAVASALDTFRPAGEPLSAYHLGAGALTVPRYLAATRPGTDSVVSEIDDGVVAVATEDLGVRPDGVEVRVEDGRLGLREQADDSRDVVVGDAFGGVSVPWHLTTREAMTDVRRVLRDDGAYVANLIDHGALGFARAEVRTLAGVFDHVALAATPAALDREAGGNLVAVASDAPIDVRAWQQRLDEREVGWGVITGDDLDAWTGEAEELTDSFAPVDQLLTPYPTF